MQCAIISLVKRLNFYRGLTMNKEKKVRRKKLRWQVAAVLILFNVLSVVIGGIGIYYGSTETYLAAKNDMMERDLRIESDILKNVVAPSWYFDYVHEHSDEVFEEITAQEAELFYDVQNRSQSDKEIVEAIVNGSEELQLAAAKMNYSIIKTSLDYEFGYYSYDGLYLIDIREADRGFLYYCASKNDDTDNKAGAVWDYDLDDHEAAEKILSEDHAKVEFERVDDLNHNGKRYYVGCLPLKYDGEVKAVLCLEYDWDPFDKDLKKNIRITGLLSLIGMLITCGLLMAVVDRIAARPLSKLQKAVHEYTKSKNSDDVIKRTEKIKSKNEIGALSDEITDLAVEIDRYVDDINKAKENIKELSEEVMEALAHTIDAKDKYTNGHSVRVAKYSRMIAKRLGLSEWAQDDIYYMGLLHDIGKIGIPNAIINKPSRLTDEEYEIIKTHPVLGYEILSEIKSRPDLSIGARWHHERYDGKGYPDGLAGDDIPFMARIIAVADSYDTMTSNRSYRKFLPQNVVREEIEKNMGTQFDPKPAEIMLEIIDEDTAYELHE